MYIHHLMYAREEFEHRWLRGVWQVLFCVYDCLKKIKFSVIRPFPGGVRQFFTRAPAREHTHTLTSLILMRSASKQVPLKKSGRLQYNSGSHKNSVTISVVRKACFYTHTHTHTHTHKSQCRGAEGRHTHTYTITHTHNHTHKSQWPYMHLLGKESIAAKEEAHSVVNFLFLLMFIYFTSLEKKPSQLRRRHIRSLFSIGHSKISGCCNGCSCVCVCVCVCCVCV